MIKIVIADDEAIIRHGQRKLISRNFDDYEIYEAKNGQELIDLVVQYNPELVITDIRMPIIDGLEAIKQIRKMKYQTNFIIISGYDLFEYAKQAIEYGVEAYLLKPFDNEEYLAKIRSILKTSGKATTEDMINYLNEHYNDPELNLSRMEQIFSRGRTSINDYFKHHLNMTPIEYINYLKIEKAKYYLDSSSMKIIDISNELNFSNQHYFSKVFKDHTGMTPSQYKNRNS